MFVIKFTTTALNQFNELKTKSERVKNPKKKASKQEGLFRQVKKSIRLLSQNPRHPGLKTHEFSAMEHPWNSKEKVFEAYAQNRTASAYRIFWCYGPNSKEITVIAITPHP